MDAVLLDALKLAAPKVLAEAAKHHSIGPWSCDEENCGGGLNIRDRQGNIIGYTSITYKNYERVTTDQARANAALMSAAPDMLLALQSLATAGMGDVSNAKEYERQVMEIARAAIPKNI